MEKSAFDEAFESIMELNIFNHILMILKPRFSVPYGSSHGERSLQVQTGFQRGKAKQQNV